MAKRTEEVRNGALGKESRDLRLACKLARECYPRHSGLQWSPTSFTRTEQSSNQTVIAFPGTCHPDDVSIDADIAPVQLITARAFQASTPDANVHEGFLSRYDGIADTDEYKRALQDSAGAKDLIFTGHSLGGAVAILAALDYKLRQANRDTGYPVDVRVRCITFGAPLVGDAKLAQLVRGREGWNRDFLHVVSRNDIVPRILIAKLEGTGRVMGSFFGRASSQEATLELQNIEKDDPLPVETELSWHQLWYKVQTACNNVMRGANNLIVGLSNVDISNYRPFGEYLLCTDAGSGRYEDHWEALQMLALTMGRSASPISSGSDVLREHKSASYIAAVSKLDLEEPRWKRVSVGLIDTNTPAELASHLAQKDQLEMTAEARTDMKHMLSLQKAMERQLYRWANGALPPGSAQYTAVPTIQAMAERPVVDAQQLALNMQRRADLYSDVADDITGLTRLLADPHNLEIYRLAGQTDTFRELNDAENSIAAQIDKHRRRLRDFWDGAFEEYTNGLLPTNFFSRTSRWLPRADAHRLQVEPVDIINYYRRKLHADGKSQGKRHYLEDDNRPARYVFIQRLWADEHPSEGVKDSIGLAKKEAVAADAKDAAEH